MVLEGAQAGVEVDLGGAGGVALGVAGGVVAGEGEALGGAEVLAGVEGLGRALVEVAAGGVVEAVEGGLADAVVDEGVVVGVGALDEAGTDELVEGAAEERGGDGADAGEEIEAEAAAEDDSQYARCRDKLQQWFAA